MKRANQLQPLSRQHHLGLAIARHAKECMDDTKLMVKHGPELKNYINSHMQNHFKVEDDLMLAKLDRYKQANPKIAEVIAKIAEQHQNLYQLNSLLRLNANQVQELAHALYDHIRFKERELFVLAQETLSENELNAIYDASSKNVKREQERC